MDMGRATVEIRAVLAATAVALACGQRGEAAPPAAPSAAPAPAPLAAAPELEERALAIVRGAARFLRGPERFTVTVDTDYDTVQPESGEKLEFGGSRRISIQRPDRIRVEARPRDGAPRVTTFDGRLLTVLDVAQNAYAQVERPGDIDATLDFVQDDLSIPIPLAELWRADPSRDLEADLRVAYLAGTEELGGVRCDHVFLRNDRADAQLWIEQGEASLFHRVVVTYRNEEGQPALRARFSDWNFAPDGGEEAFRFSPPAGAERILFAVRPRATETEAE
jgi:hypothetical protein